MKLQSSVKALDGGWAWVIVVVSFMGQLLAYGSPQSVGVLYPEWLNTYQEGKGLTAWVGSLVSGVGLIGSPVCSACVMNFGARPVTIFSGVMVAGGLMLSAFAPNVQFLMFSYGIVVGLGCGLVYAATVTITCQYFDKKRGLALGIVTTGTSVGGFLYATVQNELIELFGLDGCLLIIGALSLNLMACAGPMRPLHVPGYYLKQKAGFQRNEEEMFSQTDKLPPTENTVKSTTGTAEKTSNTSDLLITVDTKDPLAYDRGFPCRAALIKIIKKKQQAYSSYMHTTAEFLQNRVFMSLCISHFLFCLGTFSPVLLIEDVAQSMGLIDSIAVIPLVSILSITTGLGKLGLGVLADLRWINSLYLYAFTVVGIGLSVVLIPVTNSYFGLQILCGVIGFFSGNWSITPYVTTKIVGIDRLTQGYGILMFFCGFGMMLGPPIVGWFYDWTESYNLAFYLSGGCVLLGGVSFIFSILPCWNKNENKKENPRPDIQYSSNCEKVASVA